MEDKTATRMHSFRDRAGDAAHLTSLTLRSSCMTPLRKYIAYTERTRKSVGLANHVAPISAREEAPCSRGTADHCPRGGDRPLGKRTDCNGAAVFPLQSCSVSNAARIRRFRSRQKSIERTTMSHFHGRSSILLESPWRHRGCCRQLSQLPLGSCRCSLSPRKQASNAVAWRDTVRTLAFPLRTPPA